MPPPPPPPDLADDAISEILLRLPPDEPQWLFRAALVCKPWLRILSDPAFLRRYRDFHGAPPLLGLIDGGVIIGGSVAPFFVLTTAVPAFPAPESDGAPYALPLDCRHGRVLFEMWGGDQSYYHVCDPVTGDRHRVPDPQIRDWSASRVPNSEFRTWWTCQTLAAVFCAAAGCDHADCHDGPFCLVHMSIRRTSPRAIPSMWAAMYSSEIGAWRAPVTLENVPHNDAYIRGPLIGGEVYFALPKAATIVKYDWANNFLSVVMPQPPEMHNGFALMVMEDRSLGLVGIEDSRLHLWSRRVGLEGTAEWIQCRVIDLEKSMPMVNPSDSASVVCFAEGVGVIFVSTGAGLFMMELNSGRIRKVEKPMPWGFKNILPYMSFYTPDRLLGRPADL